MAKIHTNDKGFLIIKMTRKEFLSIGGLSRCDGCNTPMDEGFSACSRFSSFIQKRYPLLRISRNNSTYPLCDGYSIVVPHLRKPN